jgi:hypothetical protein
VNTIASRLTLATTTAMRPFGYQHLVASAAAVSVANHVSGAGVAVVLLLVVVFVAALSSAARGMAAVLSELLRAVAAVTSVLFAIVIALFIAVIFLVHN